MNLRVSPGGFTGRCNRPSQSTLPSTAQRFWGTMIRDGVWLGSRTLERHRVGSVRDGTEIDMKTRILLLLAVGLTWLFAGAAWSRTDSPPRYTPSNSSPGYTPSYTPKLERP